MLHFLQKTKAAAVCLLAVRLYLGWMWVTSGFGKVTGGFDASGFLEAAVANPVMKGEGLAFPLYHAFLENVALPNAGLFSFFVMWGEIFVGIGLIVGLLTRSAAFFGSTMNMSFLLAGTVSNNPIMLILSIFILISKNNAGTIGLDRYAAPLMGQWPLLQGKPKRKAKSA
ncbi:MULTISPECIES: DoxX family protein [Shouchella]|jgi:thiosulfate dehydrogenase (quinone) large subunit|uniref:DoxX family protein n=2 Tax=Shouchella TaxID=2893057 RepID=A0A268P0A9_SHOCL|nr:MULTISPECIES: DoxX family protein [Shouchella]MBX0319371.1 DoxX family protein [Shouchella clausii]MCZ1182827.1 DoxX family protein [Shouchella clausii]MDO7266443.1 DoxX family protein [Shouchella clausii]MDO7286642.1 DoxX family protein [Shouchella clausii]PAD16887.1 DoxX family protein [Shouchella clausii]